MRMAKLISRFIFWITGWKVIGELPDGVKKAVMIAAPHTSNWDFLYTRCAFFLLDIPVRYTVKKELMKFPLGILLKALGAIPIDRGPKGSTNRISMVDAMSNLFDEHNELVVLVTPEGTRKYVEQWKTGFYRVAEKSNLPIILGFVDYPSKTAGIGPSFQSTGEVEKDISEIMKFYRTKIGKYPELGVK